MSVDSRKTPYYLINFEKLKENYLSFKDAIVAVGRTDDIIAYSTKANYNPAIIEQLHNLGSYFEVCSEYEYELMLNYGVSPSRIIVNGCFYDDFGRFKDSILILDSAVQVSKWIENGCKEEIGIRVNLDDSTVDERFKNKKSRFGVNFRSVELKALLKTANLQNVVCLHCHLSGNTREPSIYRYVITQLQKICDEYQLSGLKYFDIGGGYKTGDGFWSFTDYVNAVKGACSKNIRIIFEPGNALVRNCAEYHTKIIAVKPYNDESIFIVDGSSLQIPKVDYNKLEYRVDRAAANRKAFCGTRFCGNTCKESDLLLQLDKKQSLSIGDELVLENIGAYSLNEINPLILGFPNIYFTACTKRILGNRIFTFLCNYKDCYNAKGGSDLSIIKKTAVQKGLYAFINKDGVVIYIGTAHDRNLSERIAQHFRKEDTGGLRKKLSGNDNSIRELENSSLYICLIDQTEQNLLFEEAYLIGKIKPKFNFLET